MQQRLRKANCNSPIGFSNLLDLIKNFVVSAKRIVPAQPQRDSWQPQDRTLLLTSCCALARELRQHRSEIDVSTIQQDFDEVREP